MKIVYIARFFWPTMGAAATGTLELARRLANHGHEVILFAPELWDSRTKVNRPLPALPKTLAIAYSRPRLSRMPANTLSFVFLGLKALQAVCGADVIFAQHHYGLHWASLCGAILSMITRKPLVIKAHDVFYTSTNTLESILGFVMKWVTWVSFKQAEQVLVTAEESVEMVRRVYGLEAGKVRVSLNGVDTRIFSLRHRSEELRQRIGSKHIVLFAGNIDLDSDASGLDVLIGAAKLLRGGIPDLKVLIIGDGRHLARLVGLADSLGLDTCVQFLGWVCSELIPVYLASADVGIGWLRPTIGNIGSTPLKVPEYMASGCVVLVGRGACPEDLVTDGINGIVVESGGVTEVAKGIMRAFSDEELAAKLRNKARETAEKVYDWEVIASELEDTLRSTAELRR